MFKEGEEHFIWNFNYSKEEDCLSEATLHACDGCGKPAYVNAVWIMGGPSEYVEKAKDQASGLLAEYGKITELGADSEGNCYCENCYDSHAVLEEA